MTKKAAADLQVVTVEAKEELASSSSPSSSPFIPVSTSLQRDVDVVGVRDRMEQVE